MDRATGDYDAAARGRGGRRRGVANIRADAAAEEAAGSSVPERQARCRGGGFAAFCSATTEYADTLGERERGTTRASERACGEGPRPAPIAAAEKEGAMNFPYLVARGSAPFRSAVCRFATIFIINFPAARRSAWRGNAPSRNDLHYSFSDSAWFRCALHGRVPHRRVPLRNDFYPTFSRRRYVSLCCAPYCSAQQRRAPQRFFLYIFLAACRCASHGNAPPCTAPTFITNPILLPICGLWLRSARHGIARHGPATHRT